MFLRRNLTGLLMLVMAMAAIGGKAQTRPRPVLHMYFTIPQGVDPPFQVDITSLNAGYGFTGGDLLDNGVELHGRIPGAQPGTLEDIDQLVFKFVFAGQVDVQMFENGGYALWDHMEVDDPLVTDGHIVTLTALGPVGMSGGSAPINDYFVPDNSVFQSFGALLVSFDNVNDTTTFRNTSFNVTATLGGQDRSNANLTPEPGALASAASAVGVLGGLLWARRVRRR